MILALRTVPMDAQTIGNLSSALRVLRATLDHWDYLLKHETTSYEQFIRHLGTIANFYYPQQDQENP